MAFTFTHGSIATFDVNGVDISKAVTEVTFDQKRKVDEVEPCGGSSVVKVVGPLNQTIKFKGLMDGGIDTALQALVDKGDVVPWTFAPQNGKGGSKTGNGYLSDYSPDISGSKAAMFSGEIAVIPADAILI